MDYKVVTILSDLSCILLYKVPTNLYNEISEYLKVQTPRRGNFPYFQELYDNLCKDEENQDPNLKSYYDEIRKCDTIDVTLIQEY